jgi:hypothetical protein
MIPNERKKRHMLNNTEAYTTALGKFGELALRSDDLDGILTEACHLVAKALGTDLAKVLELQENGEVLLVRAGIGWKPGVVGVMTVSATGDTSEAIVLTNRYDFTDLSGLSAAWTLKQLGELLAEGTFAIPDVAPNETVTAPFPTALNFDGPEQVFELQFRLTEATPWAEAGHEIAVAAQQRVLQRHRVLNLMTHIDPWKRPDRDHARQPAP